MAGKAKKPQQWCHHCNDLHEHPCPSPEAIQLHCEMIQEGWEDYDHWKRSHFRIETRDDGLWCPYPATMHKKDRENHTTWEPLQLSRIYLERTDDGT